MQYFRAYENLGEDEAQSPCRVYVLRVNNAGERSGNDFCNFVCEIGTISEYFHAFGSQPNKTAKSLVWEFCTIERTKLLDPKLLEKICAEVTSHANYLQSRILPKRILIKQRMARKFWTIARSKSLDSDFPKKLCAEVILYANYLQIKNLSKTILINISSQQWYSYELNTSSLPVSHVKVYARF